MLRKWCMGSGIQIITVGIDVRFVTFGSHCVLSTTTAPTAAQRWMVMGMVVDVGVVKNHIKPKADSTLYNMRKVDLIEYIRTLEYNYNVAVSFNENQAKYIESLDVAEVVHGNWVAVPSSDMMTGKAYKCSECGKMRYGSFMPNYCQNCGAKMDGGL